jgi:TPR repeat protein
LLCPCAHAQQDEVARKRFLAAEAKAEQGDADAQFLLGLRYYQGNGVAKDFVEAVKWYRKAAEQGHLFAQMSLGYCYKDGEESRLGG